MSVRSGQSITVEFTTSRFDTGAAANADSTPTGTLVVNGTDNGASVTITNVDTGRYKAAVTMPSLSVGDIVELSVAATVNSVAGKGIVWRDTKDVVLDASGRALADLDTIKTQPVSAGGAVVFGAVVGQTYALAADSSGRVVLQPSQPGVVIPTVTTLTDGVNTTQWGGVAVGGMPLAQTYMPANWQFQVIDGSGVTAANITQVAGEDVELSASLDDVKDDTTSLLGRLTATRAGYLDNLSGGAVALDSTAQAVKTKTDNLPSSPAAVGSPMTLADGAITDATFTVPSLTGPASGPVGYLTQLWRRFFRKAVKDATQIRLYADDDETVVTTQAYTASGANETVETAA